MKEKRSRHDQHDDAAARDFDAEGRPLTRQEDEAAGTGAPGVDVGKPDASPPEETPVDE
jgi:hypothetical protein